jgi:dolichyl-phosphate beta-glucosyltransferase
VRGAAGTLPKTVSVLVVDDGSTDGTAALVRARPEFVGEVLRPDEATAAAESRDCPALGLLTVPHGGKGSAVRAGMLAAEGDLIVFADADMATPPDMLPRIVAALEAADVALGSRIQPDGSDMRATQPRFRRMVGRVFRFAAQLWVTGPVRDTQCGFKGFRRDAAHDLFERLRITSIVFDVDLIYLARRRGYRIAIVPIVWADRRGSRMQARPISRSASPGISFESGSCTAASAGSSRRQRARPGLTRAPPAHDRRRVAGPKALAARRRHRPRLLPLSPGPDGGPDIERRRQARSATTTRVTRARRSTSLDGQPIYDNAFSISVGTCPGTYTYPPAFAVALIPWLRLWRRGRRRFGAWRWPLASWPAWLVLPVRRDVRWLRRVVAAVRLAAAVCDQARSGGAASLPWFRRGVALDGPARGLLAWSPRWAG